MKIYIAADMEGVSGIVHGSATIQPHADYERYRKLMTQEVNAAIEGAFEKGAMEVLVNEGHGSMRNILIEDLHPEARLISGYPKYHLQLTGLDASFDGAFFIGFHARSNTPGVLAHTFFGFSIYEVNCPAYGRGSLRVRRTSSRTWIRKLSFYPWLFVVENPSIAKRRIPRSQRVLAIGPPTDLSANRTWLEY